MPEAIARPPLVTQLWQGLRGVDGNSEAGPASLPVLRALRASSSPLPGQATEGGEGPPSVGAA